MSKPEFRLGQKVKIVRILDDSTSKNLIGYEGAITEVEPLSNGKFNYFVDRYYMREEELEAVPWEHLSNPSE